MDTDTHGCGVSASSRSTGRRLEQNCMVMSWRNALLGLVAGRRNKSYVNDKPVSSSVGGQFATQTNTRRTFRRIADLRTSALSNPGTFLGCNGFQVASVHSIAERSPIVCSLPIDVDSRGHATAIVQYSNAAVRLGGVIPSHHARSRTRADLADLGARRKDCLCVEDVSSPG